jgi:hypothetical protein
MAGGKRFANQLTVKLGGAMLCSVSVRFAYRTDAIP